MNRWARKIGPCPRCGLFFSGFGRPDTTYTAWAASGSPPETSAHALSFDGLSFSVDSPPHRGRPSSSDPRDGTRSSDVAPEPVGRRCRAIDARAVDRLRYPRSRRGRGASGTPHPASPRGPSRSSHPTPPSQGLGMPELGRASECCLRPSCARKNDGPADEIAQFLKVSAGPSFYQAQRKGRSATSLACPAQPRHLSPGEGGSGCDERQAPLRPRSIKKECLRHAFFEEPLPRPFFWLRLTRHDEILSRKQRYRRNGGEGVEEKGGREIGPKRR